MNKLIFKSKQRFKSDRHVFSEEINKTANIALSSNDDKRMQSIYLIETQKHCNDSKVFFEYSNMNDIYKNFEEDN